LQPTAEVTAKLNEEGHSSDAYMGNPVSTKQEEKLHHLAFTINICTINCLGT